MREFLIFGLAPALAVTLWLLWVSNTAIRKIERRWPRRLARLGALFAGLVALRILIPVFFGFLDSGTWLCPVCGAQEEESRYLGIVLSRGPPEEDEFSLSSAERYASWFQRSFHLAHDHAWIPVGCHGIGMSVMACSGTVEQSLFHASLPLVPDAGFARRLVEHLRDVSPELGWSLLRDFNRGWEGGPFRALVEGEHPPPQAFDDWLAEHPLWP